MRLRITLQSFVESFSLKVRRKRINTRRRQMRFDSATTKKTKKTLVSRCAIELSPDRDKKAFYRLFIGDIWLIKFKYAVALQSFFFF